MDLCEFLAEDELVEIIPNFKYNKQLNLISGDFGPFIPSVPVKVPLWMALNLRRQHKCTIIPPTWVTDLLKEQEDQQDRSTLTPMPSEYWREILHELRGHLSEQPNFSSLIEHREAILKNSVHALFRHVFESNALMITDVTLHNVSRGELQRIKMFLQTAFFQFQKLRTLYAYK